MTADELLVTMRAALQAEREAIRRFDARAVTEATRTKEDIIQKMMASPPADRVKLIAALGELKVDLRRNLLLLAHARDYLRDAIELCSKPAGRPRLEARL
jgi:hypothetical protein